MPLDRFLFKELVRDLAIQLAKVYLLKPFFSARFATYDLDQTQAKKSGNQVPRPSVKDMPNPD